MSEPSTESQRIAKSVAQKRSLKCRHFNGVQNDKCKAGICYKELSRDHEFQLPCLPNFVNVSKRSVAQCEKFATFTVAEIEEQEKELNDHLGKMEKVMAAIAPIRKQVKAGGKSVGMLIDCPACGGTKTLGLSFSSYNWHCHGRCKTPGCVSWME